MARKKRSSGSKKGSGGKGKPAVLSLGKSKKSPPKVRIGYGPRSPKTGQKASRKRVRQVRPKGKSYKRK